MLENIEKIFKALSDEKRLRIVKLLEQGPKCVCELAFVLNITQPAVSKHLKKMKGAGIIGCVQDGFWTNYYLKREGVHVRVLLKSIRGWMNADRLVGKDRRKIKKADRSNLCCPR